MAFTLNSNPNNRRRTSSAPINNKVADLRDVLPNTLSSVDSSGNNPFSSLKAVTTTPGVEVTFSDAEAREKDLNNNQKILDGETGRAKQLRLKRDSLGKNTAKYARVDGRYQNEMKRESLKVLKAKKRKDGQVENVRERVDKKIINEFGVTALNTLKPQGITKVTGNSLKPDLSKIKWK